MTMQTWAGWERLAKLRQQVWAFIFGNGSHQRWTAAIAVVCLAVLGAVPGNFLTDLIKGVGSPDQTLTWPYAIVSLGLIPVVIFLGFVTFRQFGLFGVTMVGHNEVRKVQVLVLTISLPFRQGWQTDRDAQKKRLEVLVKHVRDRARGNSRETFATLTAPNAQVASDLDGTIPRQLKDLSWQQGWRILRDQFADTRPTDKITLQKIILLTSSYFHDGGGAEDFRRYCEVLRLLLEAEGCTTADLDKTPPAGSPRPVEVHRVKIDEDTLETVQESFRGLVEENSGRSIGIDITGGTRIYAFVGALAALADNCFMFYVTDAAGGVGTAEDKEEKVRCYDLRPELQSVPSRSDKAERDAVKQASSTARADAA